MMMINNNKNLDKRKILIADDDDDSREMLAFLLQAEGWEVQEAKDGKEAIEKIVEESPDVLILDNRMPEITGVELYQKIKDKSINLPVIFATAYHFPEDLIETLGIAYFVTKPYDITDLLNIVESAYTHFHSSV